MSVESKETTLFERYQDQFNTEEGRREWEEDADFGQRISRCTAVGSAFALVAGAAKLTKNPYVDKALAVGGLAGLVVSYDWSRISGNVKTMVKYASGYSRDVWETPEKLSDELFDGTVSKLITRPCYVEYLKIKEEELIPTTPS